MSVSTAPVSMDTGTVVTVTDSTHLEVDLGERNVTVLVPATLIGAAAAGAFVRVAVQENTYALDSVISSPAASMVPVGCILPYAGSAAPTGWLICDGSSFSSTTYPVLYAVLGGTTLPDMRDRVPIGKSGTKSLNSTGGAASVTLTTNELPAHTHDISNIAIGSIVEGAGSSANVYYPPGSGSSATTSTGSGNSFSILPPYRALNYIVRAA